MERVSHMEYLLKTWITCFCVCASLFFRVCWSRSPASETLESCRWRWWELKDSWLLTWLVINKMSLMYSSYILYCNLYFYSVLYLLWFLLNLSLNLFFTVFQERVILSVCWSWITTDFRHTLFTRTWIQSGTKSLRCESSSYICLLLLSPTQSLSSMSAVSSGSRAVAQLFKVYNVQCTIKHGI